MPAKNICTECSLTEFREIVRELERNERVVDRALSHPREYFEERGYFTPPEARFSVIHTEKLRAQLQTERGIDEFLGDQPSLAFNVHIKEGRGKCTNLSVE